MTGRVSGRRRPPSIRRALLAFRGAARIEHPREFPDDDRDTLDNSQSCSYSVVPLESGREGV